MMEPQQPRERLRVGPDDLTTDRIPIRPEVLALEARRVAEEIGDWTPPTIAPLPRRLRPEG